MAWNVLGVLPSILSHLRVSRLKIDLLVNFNVPVLQDGLKRIVL